MLVEGDVDTLTTATHSDTRITLALLNGSSTQVGKVGIVTTLLAVGTEVLIGNTLFVKPALDGLLDRITCVVAAQGHGNAGFQN
jgi:hypothetical protein